MERSGRNGLPSNLIQIFWSDPTDRSKAQMFCVPFNNLTVLAELMECPKLIAKKKTYKKFKIRQIIEASFVNPLWRKYSRNLNIFVSKIEVLFSASSLELNIKQFKSSMVFVFIIHHAELKYFMTTFHDS